MTAEEEREAIYKLLATEALRLLKISLEFQDKKPSYEFLKIASIGPRWISSRKQHMKRIEKSFLVCSLLLDLIVNKPEIIVFMITNLYENHLNLVKERKISTNKKFHSFLAQNIKSSSIRSLDYVSYYTIDTNVGNFIFKVCESLLSKNTHVLIQTVKEHSQMIEKLSEDFDSFKAYMEFLNVYSCVIEALYEIYLSGGQNYMIMSSKPEYVIKILEFYKKYYEKLYSELRLWHETFIRNPITNNTMYTLTPRKKQSFAFTFTIYYLMIKTIECIVRASAKINALMPIRGNDSDKEIETKLKLRKSIIDYLFDTYVHFCENVLLEPWREGSVGEGIYRYFVLPSTPARKTVAATLLEPTYKLIHKELEFDLLYNAITKNNPDNPYKEYKQKIYEIVTCKSIIDRWIDCLFHNNNLIWEAKFEKR